MKKILFSIIGLIIIIVSITIIFLNNKKDSNLKKIKVAEVTHSVFYAPQYAAHALGYLKKKD